MFELGKKLMDEGRIEEACPRFEASYEAERTLGTLLNLANCYERAGKIATAWARWGEAVELARKLGDDRVEFASERREGLTPRLPKLVVKVDDPAVKLTVLRDDTRLEPATFGVALPVDPGQRVVRVKDGERILHQEVVTVTESRQVEVVLSLSAIEAANKEVEDTTPPPVVQPPPPPPEETTSAQLIAGFVVAGVGVSGIIAAGVLGGVALSNKGDADSPDSCVGQSTLYCTQSGIDSLESAETFANVSQWVGIGSLLVTAIGVTLIVTAPSDEGTLSERAERETPRLSASLSPWVGPAAGGVAITVRSP